MKIEGKIRVLDRIVADQIAAGEVVDRPASVVKELVENAIDAGATEVNIEILQGGTVLIQIADDGEGMVPQDLLLSVKRHATSKIKLLEDLAILHTLGFRGEALASISSVSKMKIISKKRGTEEEGAYMFTIDGGVPGTLNKTVRALGTTIEVAELFYNVPARQKFLKKESTEFAHIMKVVEIFILSFPQIRFKLVHNHKQIYASPGDGNLISAISCVYPAELINNLAGMTYANDKVSLHGYVTNAQYSCADRSKQLFFVNSRHVSNSTLSKALEDGYHNLLEVHRHPAGIVFLDLDPKDIDVNVHPSKREIKFCDSSLIYNVIKSGVSSALQVSRDQDVFDFSKVSQQTFNSMEMSKVQKVQTDFFNFLPNMGNVQVALQNFTPFGPLKTGNIMQVLDTYLVEQKDNCMIIYDQHALHERIVFEKLKAGQTGFQRLLIPEMVFSSKSEIVMVMEYRTMFTDAGFEIDFFGEDCILIRSVPDYLTGRNVREIFIQMIADIVNLNRAQAHETVKDSILKIIACRSAVKAGDKLKVDVIEKIFELARHTPNIETCPHGRPTFIRFTKSDLEKMFHRK